MSATENILVEVSPGETRAAFVSSDGGLRELIIERRCRPNLIDAIFLGRVVKIESGIGAAFVDIGMPETAFLDRATGLHEGQPVIVQVIRAAASGKGPTVRRRISLAGRYLVLTPYGENVSWPRGAGGRRRAQLEQVFAGIPREGEGWAIRSTAIHSEGKPIDFGVLAKEAERLRKLWNEIEDAAGSETPPALLLPAPPIAERLLRDRLGQGAMLIDDRQVFLESAKLARDRMPDLADAVDFHDGPEPIFELYAVEDGIAAATERTIGISRGGRLTIDTTEALTVFDVDMGGSSPRRRSEDAVLSLNMAAAEAVAQEIRLRNIAGLIVVDFVTMRAKAQRRKLVDAQRRAFRVSPVPVDVLGMTAAGLIEITRRRDGPSLDEMLIDRQSPTRRLSRESLGCAALRSALRTRGASRVKLVTSPSIGAVLRDTLFEAVSETTRRLGGGLDLEIDPNEADFHVEDGRRGR